MFRIVSTRMIRAQASFIIESKKLCIIRHSSFRKLLSVALKRDLLFFMMMLKKRDQPRVISAHSSILAKSDNTHAVKKKYYISSRILKILKYMHPVRMHLYQSVRAIAL